MSFPNPIATPVGRGLVLGLAGFSVFSLMDTQIKILTSTHGIQVAPIVALCAGVLIVLCMVYAIVTGKTADLRMNRRSDHLWLGITRAISFLLIQFAFSRLSLITVYTFVFTAPIITAILSILWLDETPTRQTWLAVGCGFVGVLVAFRPDLSGIDTAAFCALLGALFFSVGSIFMRRMRTQETALSTMFWSTIVTFAITGIVAMPNIAAPPLHLWPFFLGAALFWAAGQLAMVFAFRLAPASKIGAVHYVQVLYGLLFDLLIFKNMPDGFAIVGAGLIASAGIILLSPSPVVAQAQVAAE
ncbi:MAG: DMT family transporter [Pseudomonadota bacterium]|nr:DMT family transporter [Pseudomonadota bacterium]